MKLFYTKDIRDELVKGLKDDFARVSGKRRPRVALIYNSDSEESSVYCRSQQKILGEFGIEFVSDSFGSSADKGSLIALVEKFNCDVAVTGINIDLPLPEGCRADEVFGAVDPGKDIEGLNPKVAGMLVGGARVVVPSVVRACYELVLRFSAERKLSSPDICLINRSPLIGKPLALLLLNNRELNPTVTILHSKTRDMKRHLGAADIIVTAAGRPGLIGGDHIKSGVCIVDASTTVVDGKVRGDVDVESVGGKADLVTAVPGGVGIYTRYMFIKNIVSLCEL